MVCSLPIICVTTVKCIVKLQLLPTRQNFFFVILYYLSAIYIIGEVSTLVAISESDIKGILLKVFCHHCLL